MLWSGLRLLELGPGLRQVGLALGSTRDRARARACSFPYYIRLPKVT